jgi:glycerophosphoryl diester phosphodiesterase
MTRVYAHRGARLELPENTLPAFRRALELGADALELDCHMTRDGIIVVSHDETGSRMANVARELRASAFADVREWDVGWGFTDDAGGRPFANAGYRIPALSELLEALPDARLNIDAKQQEPNMIGNLLRTIRAHGAEERVHLASFWMKNLGRIRAAGYRGGTSLGPKEVVHMRFAPTAVLRLMSRGTRAQIPRHQGPIRLDDASFIAKCHALGVAVDYWTINDPDEARLLIERGADGIVTDDPRTIVPAVRALARAS